MDCTESRPPDLSKLPSHGDERIALFVSIIRAADIYVAEANGLCMEHGITFQQYNVLRILYIHDPGRGLACSRIGERLVARVPDITRLLDRLAKAGYIERGRCAGDRRVVRTRLTDQGRGLVEALDGPLVALLDKLSSRLGDLDLAVLTAALERIAMSLESGSD